MDRGLIFYCDEKHCVYLPGVHQHSEQNIPEIKSYLKSKEMNLFPSRRIYIFEQKL